MNQPVAPNPNPAQPIRLEGAPNFRSVAALPAANGQSIRANRLFRSDALHQLTDQDVQQLGSLGIGSVFDLRRPDERSWAPNRLPAAPPETLVFDDPSEIDAVRPATWRHQLATSQFDATAARAWMCDTYRRLPAAFARSVRLASQRLSGWHDATPPAGRPSAAPEYRAAQPILVHCTAGKDRTGFVCAMLLAAVGVTWDAIMDDYLESRRRRAPQDLALALFGADAVTDSPRTREAVEVIAGVEADFLNAAFATVHQHHGSVDHYLAEACGLGGIERERLREHLLT